MVCGALPSLFWRVQAAGGSRVRAALARLRAASLAAFLRLYPLLHMAAEGATFGYQMAYLLQASPFFSPSLHLLRQHVVRMSGQEMVRPCRPVHAEPYAWQTPCCCQPWLQPACTFSAAKAFSRR
jgi:hypothetical protein